MSLVCLDSRIKADPTANLSFNLNLTEEQRRAKNDTVLPYLKTQGEKLVHRHVRLRTVSQWLDRESSWLTIMNPVHVIESTGAIYYEPDAADDFDDDDPDDDLTI